jgi:hypothetical protein
VLSQEAAQEVEVQRQDGLQGVRDGEEPVREAIAEIEQQLGDDVGLRVEIVDGRDE